MIGQNLGGAGGGGAYVPSTYHRFWHPWHLVDGVIKDVSGLEVVPLFVDIELSVFKDQINFT